MFGGDAGKVPKRALTMGVGTILDARELLLLATGAAKASILARAVEGPITAMINASVIQLHRNCKVIIDEDARDRLVPKPKTKMESFSNRRLRALFLNSVSGSAYVLEEDVNPRTRITRGGLVPPRAYSITSSLSMVPSRECHLVPRQERSQREGRSQTRREITGCPDRGDAML